MKPPAVEYVAARSLEEALAALAAGGEDAKPIAGGQSLVPALNMRLLRPSLLVDLNRAGLDGIEADVDLRVGATARQAALQRSPHAHPLLVEALPYVGHAVTRNRGTVGGSLAHADAAAELPVCLVALGGSVVAEGPAGRREIAAEELFVSPFTTALGTGELLVESRWPLPQPNEGAAFAELALRAGDYALAIVAVVLRRDGDVARDVRIAAGAVVDRPRLLPQAAELLEGRPVSAASAGEAGAAAAAAVDPAGSIHASSRYLRQLTSVLATRACLRAWEAARGGAREPA